MASRRKVLVTGAGGFLGTALARRLAAHADDLTGLDIAPRPSSWPGRWVRAALSDRASCEAALSEADILIHAAWTGFPGTQANFRRDLDGDVGATLDLYRAACEAGVWRFVFLSSGGTVYGNAEALPIPEGAPLKPVSAYGASKAATEIYLGMLGAETGRPPAILRVANPFGPGQKPWRGQGVVATAIACALSGAEFPVWGDGEAIRDYVYVDDAADAIVLAAFAESATTYNIGSGTGLSLNAVLATVESVTGRRLRVNRSPGEHVHVRSNVLCVDRIGTELGWSPRVAFADGVRRCLAWLEADPALWQGGRPKP